MRVLLIAISFLFISATNSMADPISKEMADQYYQNCITAQSGQQISKETQDLLCACTASKMMDEMTTNDIQAMNAQDESARLAMNHMIVNVYAPCMEYPAKDHYYNTCISNPQTKTITNNPESMCNCVSNKVARYLGQNGKKVFGDILNRDPNIIDPMAALESDTEFQSYVGKQALTCI